MSLRPNSQAPDRPIRGLRCYQPPLSSHSVAGLSPV